jgi:integrase
LYWTDFRFKGQRIQKPTGTSSLRQAEAEEDRIKTELRQEWQAKATKAKQLSCDADDLRACTECQKLFHAAGVIGKYAFCSDDCEERFRRRQSPVPTLEEFLTKKFLPHTATVHAKKPNSQRYYVTGTRSLLTTHLGEIRLDKITNEHAVQYAAKMKHLTPSTINCGLRTLRHAIYLAADWGTITNRPKINLVKGEHRRDRVLSDSEVEIYLSACVPVWKIIATVLLGTTARPGEIFSLRWERVQFDDKAHIYIAEGKSLAARRELPLIPSAQQALRNHWTTCGEPSEGWCFPAATACGHVENNTAKNWHQKAIKATKEKLKRFPPYTFRHTALTRLGAENVEVHTLAKIAGHSSILMTMRYVHPQTESVERAFAKLPDSIKVDSISVQ